MKKVEVIQDTPYTAAIPIKPARNTEPLANLALSTLPITMMKHAQQSMTIWTIFGIDKRLVFPAALVKWGSKSGNVP